MSSTAPDLSRFMLPPMKASGLLFSKATSIWSSEMLAGLFCAAILPAVSPGLTATFWPFDAGERASGLALGEAGWGRALVTGAGLTDAWAGGGDGG